MVFQFKTCEFSTRSSLPVAMVVEKCGYGSDGFAKKLFLSRTGMTMREYRKANAPSPS